MLFENNPLLKKIISSSVLLIIALCIVLVLTPLVKKDEKATTPSEVSLSEPKRTDYKGVFPPLFPSNIQIRASDTLSQSYSKDYGVLQQSSVVLFSAEDARMSFSFYKDLFAKDGYSISTSTESKALSVLIVDKPGSHIEVTFIDKATSDKHQSATTTDSIKSHVIINAFKK